MLIGHAGLDSMPFAPEPQVPACAPVFYHRAIQIWQRLDLVPAPIERREQLDAMPLHMGQSARPPAQLNNAREYRPRLCDLRQVMTWDCLIMP